MHYDRPYYNLTDTLWLKGYIVSAVENAASDSSKIAYVEIISSAGVVVKRISAWCSSGIFYSNIILNKTDFTQGTYLLRAYTNHMRNYGDSLFFQSRFKVIDVADNQWKLAVHKISILNKRFIVDATLQPFSDSTERLKNWSFILRNKNKILFKGNISTDIKGNIAIDTLLNNEDNSPELQLEVADSNGFKIQLPVHADEALKMDLQFLPEGGTFLANKLQQLGFKAVDIFGRGIAVKGRIENSRKQLITTFSSVHNGMGTVWLTPEVNEVYTAVLDDGTAFKLPLPQQSGTQLKVTNLPASDSIEVMVDASPDLYNKAYFFRASAKGISCAMGKILLHDKSYWLSFSKKTFPSGICRFTLYNDQLLPVNERIILVWHSDTLNLTLALQKPIYSTRDSVHVLLTAKNFRNIPAQGSFSVAVIDTTAVHYTKHAENIISYLLLGSDLKGNIEEPAYYFDHPLPEATEALMLTQGWVHYNYANADPIFKYDTAFTTTGSIVNLLNKPVAKANISLFGKDGRANVFFLNTVTDKKGKFTFSNFPFFTTDSVNMLLKYMAKNDNPLGIGVEVDLPVFPEYHASMESYIPESILYDTNAANTVQQRVKLYNRLKKEKGYLQEVIVTTRSKIPGSKNLNADGGADQVITGKALEKFSGKNLLDILQETTGLYVGTFPKSREQVYKIKDNIAVFIIDGINTFSDYVELGHPGFFARYLLYTKSFLTPIAAEDIAGIEIMSTIKNSRAYETFYEMQRNIYASATFIEITTYAGKGKYNKSVPGTYLYKPLAPVIAKTFYSPRYATVEKDNPLPDYRSTVYWKPDITTNEKGEAEFSFYTSDSGRGGMIIVQGTDLNGGLGVAYFPLVINKEEKKTNE